MNDIQHTDIPSQSHTLTVHQAFQGASHFSKLLRQGALLLEILAGFIASWGTFSTEVLWGGWASPVMLLLLCSAGGLRMWARSTQSFAEKCRRVSIRYFSLGGDVPVSAVSGIVADFPPLWKKFADKHPTGTLDEYYEPTKNLGLGRLRELNAHSSFYTWRLLRFDGWLLLGTTLITACIGSAIIYAVALPNTDVSHSGKVLEVTCSLVFVLLMIKALDGSITSFLAASRTRKIADKLIEPHRLEIESLEEQVAQYDIERACGPVVSSLGYKAMREGLQKEWHMYRTDLDDIQ